MSSLLKSRGIHFQYILDEGGGIVEGMIPHVQNLLAFIGVAEKGNVTLQLSVNGTGGHSSVPADEDAIGVLSSAVYKLENKQFPSKLTKAVREMCQSIGEKMNGIQGFTMRHPVLFAKVIKWRMSKIPVTRALLHTTMAPTLIESGIQDNVMPTCSRVLINFRIIPGETVESVMASVKHIINDNRVDITTLKHTFNPSKTTSTLSAGYKVLKLSIEEVFPKVAVSPGLNVAYSDSRQYENLTDNIVRFVPVIMKNGDGHRMHGENERILETNYRDAILFYCHFIMNANMGFEDFVRE